MLERIAKRHNFRELGGYTSEDGRKVKQGLFYRCGALAGLNEEEQEIFRSLGIRTIYDFRGIEEAEKKPDMIPEGTEYKLLPAFKWSPSENAQENDNLSPEEMEKRLLTQVMEDEHDFFKEVIYGNLGFSPSYQVMFEDLKQGKTPIVFHCSAGKDRTGIAGILILLALGVDYETAMQDYLLTNEYRQEQINAIHARASKYFDMTPERTDKLLVFEGVARRNADYTFEKVLEKFGTIENYFEKQYGLDKEGLNRLRDLYME